tara:strand:+ start:757 stop:1071 length:315 start_codon:yes stop_codon:yes gene_type:complete
MNIELKIDKYYQVVSDLKDNESFYPSDVVQNLYRESIQLKREIKSSLLEVRQNIIDEIKMEEKFLNSLDSSDEWESRKIEELENSIYERNKDLFHVEEEIKRFK